jgi:hypothetical protein
MFPVGTGNDKETMRRRTLTAGTTLRDHAANAPETAAAAITGGAAEDFEERRDGSAADPRISYV